jgi:hypothetical protein
MLKTAVKFGVISGAIIIAAIIVPFWWQSVDAILADPEGFKASMRRGEVVGYLSMLVAMSLVFFAMREHRNRLGGSLGFLQGMKVGVLVTLVSATLFGVATGIMYAAMGVEHTDAFMRLYMEHAAGADPVAQARALADYEANRDLWLNHWFQGFVMFATVVPIGVLVSLPSAWWHSRR